MKNAFLFILIALSSQVNAQYLQVDSLSGFDIANVVTAAHDMNFTAQQTKVYVSQLAREFINKKFSLGTNTVVQRSPKLGGGIADNGFCTWDDFEACSPGLYNVNFGWATAQCSTCSPICASGMVAMQNNTSAVAVYTTPLTDAVIGTVTTSPFGGLKVAKINASTHATGRIAQIFSVSASISPFFHYAYQGVLCDAVHNNCCTDCFLMFRFYDQNGQVITAASQTVMQGSPPCMSTSTVGWATNTYTSQYKYMTNWNVVSVNLSAYSGSFVTIEVIAATCLNGGGHIGYMYFDALCSSDGIIANQHKHIFLQHHRSPPTRLVHQRPHYQRYRGSRHMSGRDHLPVEFRVQQRRLSPQV